MNAKELGTRCAYPDPHDNFTSTVGLTKRELLAAMAMQAILSGPLTETIAKVAANHDLRVDAAMAQAAAEYADALLVELAKEQP